MRLHLADELLHHGAWQEAARLTKELLAQYKNLHGWLGLKRSSYPQSLAEEWLRYGQANGSLRAELYVWLMKQLTEPPDGATAQKGCEPARRAEPRCDPSLGRRWTSPSDVPCLAGGSFSSPRSPTSRRRRR